MSGLAWSATLLAVGAKLKSAEAELAVFFSSASPMLGPPKVDVDGAALVDVGRAKPENAPNDGVGFWVAAAELGAPPLRKLKEVGFSAPKLVAGAVAATKPVDAGPGAPAEGLPNENVLVFGCSVGCPNTEVVGVSKSTPKGEA